MLARLEEKLSALREDEERIRSVLHATRGAISVLEQLIAEGRKDAQAIEQHDNANGHDAEATA